MPAPISRKVGEEGERGALGSRYKVAWRAGPNLGSVDWSRSARQAPRHPLRKAIHEMTTMHPQSGTRRLRAAIIGFGLDGAGDGPQQILTGTDCLIMGGSEETHADMLETMLRLESELERIGRRLGDLPPDELAEIAWRIDSPELHAIALQMEHGLVNRNQAFHELTADELSDLASGIGL